MLRAAIRALGLEYLLMMTMQPPVQLLPSRAAISDVEELRILREEYRVEVAVDSRILG